MRIDASLTPRSLAGRLARMWDLSAAKISDTARTYDPAKGSPVFTVAGRWTSRGWTEWTQGFQYGSAILQFDATGEPGFLAMGRSATVDRMAPHVSHVGVHDHGFNNVSTYGNLLRLADEGRIDAGDWERRFYQLALKVSGAVQARRWTRTADGEGFIYSFNGPHSLFVDTVRSLRSLAVAHRLGHSLMEENDVRVPLLGRLVQHARATARYSVYYGKGRDSWDVRGRVAHESIFNVVDGRYRCPNSQQGYSPFSTWTRGLAWALTGFAEQLEFIDTLADDALAPFGGRADIEGFMLEAARATADFWIDNTALDGIPYWDTGAPGLERLGDWRKKPADPFNPHEPVDSSAAAIACQGLVRLGRRLSARGGAASAAPRGGAASAAPRGGAASAAPRGGAAEAAAGGRYTAAGLAVLATLLDEPYLSVSPSHQGLLLHSVYHRPNGWDTIPPGRTVPCGESSMWGDYHLREAALHVARLDRGPYLAFFGKEEA